MYDPRVHNQMFEEAAAKYGVPPNILYGLMMTESSGRPRQGPATDSFGRPLSQRAEGYFQFMPSTAREQGITPGDFQSEVEGAARYLKQLGGKDANMVEALSRYGGYVNADPTEYINRVTGFASQFPGGATQVAQANDPAKMSADEAYKLFYGTPAPSGSAPDNKPPIGQMDPLADPNPAPPAPVRIMPSNKSDEELSKAITGLDELMVGGAGIAGSFVGGIFGSAVSPGVGTAVGAAAGGALITGLSKYFVVYDRLKTTFPDLPDERIQEFAAKQGLIDAATDAALTAAGGGIYKAWGMYKGMRQGTASFKNLTPDQRADLALRSTPQTSQIDDVIEKISGRRPGFAGAGVGSGAALGVYSDAASRMKTSIDRHLDDLRSSVTLGEPGFVVDPESIGTAFLKSRSDAMKFIGEQTKPIFDKLNTTTVAGSTRIPMGMASLGEAGKRFREFEATREIGIDSPVRDVFARASAPDMTAAQARGLRRDIDELINWPGDPTRPPIDPDLKSGLLVPLRNTISENIYRGLEATGQSAVVRELKEADALYSQMKTALSNDFMIKVAKRNPQTLAQWLGSKAGQEGVPKVDEAMQFMLKHNPSFSVQDARDFRNLIVNNYLGTFSSHEKLAELGRALTKSGLDPEMVKTFNQMTRGRPDVAKTFGNLAKSMERVKSWETAVSQSLQTVNPTGAVSAAATGGGAIGGPSGSMAAALAVNAILGGFPKAAAKAAIKQDPKMMDNIMRAARMTAVMQTPVNLLDDKFQSLMREILDYADQEENNAEQ